jgi:hypothetical protein
MSVLSQQGVDSPHNECDAGPPSPGPKDDEEHEAQTADAIRNW